MRLHEFLKQSNPPLHLITAPARVCEADRRRCGDLQTLRFAGESGYRIGTKRFPHVNISFTHFIAAGVCSW